MFYIEDLIEERDSQYKELTDLILDELDHCKEAIGMILGEHFNNFSFPDLEYDRANEVLIFSISCNYKKPLVSIDTARGEVELPTVDEDGVPYDKEFFVAIPIEMVLEDTVEEIYDFLIETEVNKDEMSTLRKNIMEEIENDIDDETMLKDRVLH